MQVFSRCGALAACLWCMVIALGSYILSYTEAYVCFLHYVLLYVNDYISTMCAKCRAWSQQVWLEGQGHASTELVLRSCAACRSQA